MDLLLSDRCGVALEHRRALLRVFHEHGTFEDPDRRIARLGHVDGPHGALRRRLPVGRRDGHRAFDGDQAFADVDLVRRDQTEGGPGRGRDDRELVGGRVDVADDEFPAVDGDLVADQEVADGRASGCIDPAAVDDVGSRRLGRINQDLGLGVARHEIELPRQLFRFRGRAESLVPALGIDPLADRAGRDESDDP